MTEGSATTGKRAGDRLFWSVVAGAAVLIVLTLIASQFVAEPPGMPRGARSLPRVPRAPATTGELLRSLAATLKAPRDEVAH